MKKENSQCISIDIEKKVLNFWDKAKTFKKSRTATLI